MGLIAWLLGDRPAPKIRYGDAIRPDQDYRLPDDPKYIIRVDQEWPDGIGARLIGDDVAVAGVSKRRANKRLRKLIRGTGRRIELIRDPNNRHDRNAIMVIARWDDKSGRHKSGQIGWVPRDIAEFIARKHRDVPIGAKITMMFRPRSDKSAGIRLAIGRPAAVRKKAKAKKKTKGG